jgi:hypothetical protein
MKEWFIDHVGSFNGEPMHSHEYLLTDVLKQELGFNSNSLWNMVSNNCLEHGYKGI